MIHLAPLLLLACLVGCRQVQPAASATPEGGLMAGLDPRYQPQMAALADTLRDGDDLVARGLAGRLRLRLRADAARGEAAAQGALELLQGFEQILEGRRLVDDLSLNLMARLAEEGGSVSVLLRGRTEVADGVELRPGGALLRVSRITLSPEGQESRSVKTLALPDLKSIDLGRDWGEVDLGTFSTSIPSNALGSRTLWSLDLLAGEILSEGGAFPAQEVAVGGVERVDLAPFLSNSPVDPADLASYARRPECALAPLLERTVRIVPSQRDEALDLLTPILDGMVAEEISLLVPSLRWLSRTGVPGRDQMAWRAWLRRRAAIRQEVRWP